MAKEVLSANSFTKEARNMMGTLESVGFGTATFGVSTFGQSATGYTQSKEPLPSKIS